MEERNPNFNALFKKKKNMQRLQQSWYQPDYILLGLTVVHSSSSLLTAECALFITET
jgi:hypothetical protein